MEGFREKPAGVEFVYGFIDSIDFPPRAASPPASTAGTPRSARRMLISFVSTRMFAGS